MLPSIRLSTLRSLSIAAICLVALFAPAVARPASVAAGSTTRSAVIEVGGQTMTIAVVVNGQFVPPINRPIKVVVTLPSGVSGTVLSADGGFNSRGWSIKFVTGKSKQSGFVTVTVPSRRGRFPTQIELSGLEMGSGGPIGWAVAVPGKTNVPTSIPFSV